MGLAFKEGSFSASDLSSAMAFRVMSNTPLDPSLYRIDPSALEFFKQQTGIAGDDELKQHILAIQAKAFSVASYPCIYNFYFTRLRISRHSKYQSVLQLGRDRRKALLLDLGCCFGNDARKAVMDGWPVAQVISTDIEREFWDLGHELFRSTPSSFPAPFILGDLFDPSFLSSESGLSLSSPTPDLFSLTSLNDLHGKLTAIHASSIFHLFSAEQQASLVCAIAALLSPEEGSIVFGSHLALPKQDTVRNEVFGVTTEMHCYDPESWNKLWKDAGVFKTETSLTEAVRPDGETVWMMEWSATRAARFAT